MFQTTSSKLILVCAVVTLLVACGGKGPVRRQSTSTGWKINDPKGGFQFNSSFKEQIAGPGLVFIEGGTFTKGKVQDDVMHDWNNTPTQQHVMSFYMDETEVTNIMYMEYLDWLKNVFPPSEERFKYVYNGAIPDTLVWRDRLGFNETMTKNYLRHPAYADYPVVGVNWIQANEFAKWRTDRVNESILENYGYLARNAKVEAVDADNIFSTEAYINSPAETFSGNEEIVYKGRGNRLATKEEARNVYAQRTSGIMLPDYRLPTEVEWEYAAIAIVGNREYNMYSGQKKYPWNGAYTRAGNSGLKGLQLANFKQGKGDYGGIAGWSDDGADITNKTKSYPPNDFGLYDMAGNVAEWVADVYRPIIDFEANDFNYYRGNVYMKNKIGEEGRAEIYTSENMKYDTLSNGKIVARSFPGQLIEVPVDEEETYLRHNFSTSDNIDYRDGDRPSTRQFDLQEENEDKEEIKEDNSRMYNSPRHVVSGDSLGNLIRKHDKLNRKTLISNSVRVYKGGSWKDREYWLDPAQRRFFPEDMATDYIGFRCAMSRVGSKSNKKNKPKHKR
ncbi:MAG: gliding motility lipoprotein GldJ [Flavobacteriales bacterium]|nr:gliding motility lipoprotein GldJ [Flavobacteriales bacterium]